MSGLRCVRVARPTRFNRGLDGGIETVISERVDCWCDHFAQSGRIVAQCDKGVSAVTKVNSWVVRKVVMLAGMMAGCVDGFDEG